MREEIKKILYIDDSLENREVAKSVDPRIIPIPNLRNLAGNLRDYDCVITDMQMETLTSGFDVVEYAVREGKLPHIVTGGTYEHGGLFERVTVFDHSECRTFNEMSKATPEFWRQAIPYIVKNEVEDSARIALSLCYSVLGEIPHDSRELALCFYQYAYKKINEGTKMKGGEKNG